MNSSSGHRQYKKDIFSKLGFKFEPNKKILDVGCGDGSDAEIFINELGLDTFGIDIYKHERIDQIRGLKFQKSEIYNIPFGDGTFDYVFLHDVLHHIDEEGQRYEKHIEGLKELKRVARKDGCIIIIEGNRYNLLFYPHMVLLKKHNHFKQSYFKKLLISVFGKESVTFKYFEAHLYPPRYLRVWKIYEKIMESIMPKSILSYNVSIITK